MWCSTNWASESTYGQTFICGCKGITYIWKYKIIKIKFAVFLYFLFFIHLFGSFFVCFLDDKSSVIRNEQSGEWEGNDESDDAQQTAPDRKAQQDDGRIEPHGTAHDARCKDEILNGLHHDKDCQRTQQDNPEVLPGVVSLDEGQNKGGNEAYRLHVWNKIEHADEKSQTYCHREIYNKEANAEKDAYKQSN